MAEQCDGRHPLIRDDGSMIYLYDLVAHPSCPHQRWAPPEEPVRVDCPPCCPHRDREHLHVEHEDGYGEVVGPDGELVEPWDLSRSARILSPIGTPSFRRVRLEGGCYDASWGRVHVRPSCRCPR